jgi:ribonucleotide reductase alpha subunit
VYGEEFNELYRTYVAQGRYKRVVKARTIWDAVLKSQIETGTPYMCYKDSVNKKSNQKNIGTIKSSNLCVAPETKILTRHGHKEIRSIYNLCICDQPVEVWNGREWSKVTVVKTSDYSGLIRVSFSNNSYSHHVLNCTEYHKFHTLNGVKDAKDLIEGDTLIDWELPDGQVIQGVQVTSVEDNGRFDETYCFNEPKRHMGIFNGVLTGNCTEIMEVSKPDETAVCNLASLSLPAFVKDGEFDFDKLCEVTRVVTRNLNRVIDKNYYPTEPAKKSNMRHRPIGIGVQGLADVFMMLGMSFDEPKARELNKFIFESIYYAALMESCLLAKEEGPYETFEGSPASQGQLQFDMWGCDASDRYPWFLVKESIKTHGLRNSLLVAPMPTASTAQILGNNEAFEPYTTNIYLRRTLAGEFVMINKHLVTDLQKIDMWRPSVKNQIIRDGGSVQSLDIPDRLKEIYRTVWEIPQKSILDMAADRGAYIDQSQSMNIFMENPTVAKLSSMHFYGWRKGLKTGMYYLRTRAKAKPQQVTVPMAEAEAAAACRRDNPEACMMCSG